MIEPDGLNLLRLLKSNRGWQEGSLCLPVGKPVVALLRPIVTKGDALSDQDLDNLSEWRNRFVKSFLTEFDATREQTRRWLVNSVDADLGKILFMLEDLNGNSIGHLGLGFINWDAKYGEADAIVRGNPAPKGLMKEALQTLIKWAKSELGLEEVCVRVRSDNTAIDFYRKSGFVEYKRVSIMASQVDSTLIWSEREGHIAPFLVYMRYAHA
ncbi:GNAT family N-acetyltransferase [Chitinibacter bivalviorum]|uniref:GNAT family N-acetyltransferase n=1 Tax=Chitinibacter bivalviorum TaxID=2739434 RepID=A0A7H9BIL5_9NEIS|nr:GNAT family N-acetyltransferase [Chitinibacter bivalviorum]QLG87394.1 GNAT family N-acetyltransferase [Chitinibacter bivalviorum]